MPFEHLTLCFHHDWQCHHNHHQLDHAVDGSWRLLIAVGKAKNITARGLYGEAIGYECSKVPTSMVWPWPPQTFEESW